MCFSVNQIDDLQSSNKNFRPLENCHLFTKNEILRTILHTTVPNTFGYLCLSAGNKVSYAKILSAILPKNKRKHLPDSVLATKMGRIKKQSQFTTIDSP